jgi:formate dehydrogenase subunit gamma
LSSGWSLLYRAGDVVRRTAAPAAVMEWMVFIHDVAFIVTGAMFFMHVYLGAFHPLMQEPWKAMTGSRMSADYARAHHARWYEEVSRGKDEKAP